MSEEIPVRRPYAWVTVRLAGVDPPAGVFFHIPDDDVCQMRMSLWKAWIWLKMRGVKPCERVKVVIETFPGDGGHGADLSAWQSELKATWQRIEWDQEAEWDAVTHTIEFMAQQEVWRQEQDAAMLARGVKAEVPADELAGV